jgi:outer membrane murein-binding lipoprotein Lpp
VSDTGQPHSASAHLLSWAQLFLLVGAYIGSLVFFMGTTQRGQEELSRSLVTLSGEVKEMGTAVNRLASVYERLDEHTKSAERETNRRLEILEKDSNVKRWTH